MDLNKVKLKNQSSNDFKKGMLKDYFEENTDNLACVHTLQNDDEIPLSRSYDIAGYLEELENKGVIEMVRKESCAFKNYPHNTYKFLPKPKRKEKEEKKMVKQKPTKENVFKAIKSRYDEGDKFYSTKILDLWSGENRGKASQSLWLLSQKNLLEKVEKVSRGGNKVNIYKLKETDYEKEGKEKTTQEKDVYECPYCDYTTDVPQGLGGHIAHKHKDKEEEKKEDKTEEYSPIEELGKVKRIEIPVTKKRERGKYQDKKEILALKIALKVLE